MPLLKVKDLSKNFGEVKALDKVSFEIFKGQTLGVVGESGSGKSTLARLILRLIARDEGQVLFEGENIRREISIIFQDPYSSLNPRMRVETILKEPFLIHKEKKDDIADLLEMVNLPVSYKNRFPHELSGGERQRVAIARAIALKPKLLIADEPLSSLDLLVQAEVIKLLRKLKTELHLTMLFISHDLRVVRSISDKVLVMKEGVIVEEGSSEEIFQSPQSEYTKRLIEAIPLGIKRKDFL